MTTRLTVDPTETKQLLGAILMEVNQDNRCMFLIGPGQGAAKMQAVRVALSRVRAKMKSKGRRLKYFNLHCSIHPHTEEGKRMDMVVVWRTQNQRHVMTESLEDLMGTGESL